MGLQRIIFVEATSTTPTIIYEPQRNSIDFIGPCVPLNALRFHQEVLMFVEEAIRLNALKAIALTFKLTRVNTYSMKCIKLLCDRFHDSFGIPLEVFWCHSNDEIKLQGEWLSSNSQKKEIRLYAMEVLER
jgi:hypothetical protein